MPDNRQRYVAQILWPSAVMIGTLLAWESIVRTLGVRPIILPAPSEILYVIATRYDLLLTHLWPSLYMTVLGFLLSVVGGIFVAILISRSTEEAAWWRHKVNPHLSIPFSTVG